MPVAVISDVHSNLHALEAVMDRIEEIGVDRIVCLGDTVGYAAHPAECLEIVRGSCDLVLLGNHDHAVAAGEAFTFNPQARAGVDYAQDELDDDAVAYLDGLDPLVREGDVCYCHASPREPIREYVFEDTPDEDLRAIAEAGQASTVMMGHTHVPMDLTVADVRLVNPGAVGQPRDNDPKASFAVWDPDAGTFENERVDYDAQAAADAVIEAGLPEFNGKRLLSGM